MSSWPSMVGENAPEIQVYLQLHFQSSCTVFILDWPSCLTGVGFDGFGDLPLIGRIFGQTATYLCPTFHDEQHRRPSPPFQIFQIIENPNELTTLKTYQALLVSKREVCQFAIIFKTHFFQVFLRSVWNESTNNVNYRWLSKSSRHLLTLFVWPRERIDSLLASYEVVVEEAVSNGIDVASQVTGK